ncbi:hypothetical protein B7486_04195 [cyanobacterium TDX16]|nr:hypothetical protein B7486_04195 [cyanobacterium TDX16]
MAIFVGLVAAHSVWAGPPEIADRPPPLTFDEHVDYVGWYNEFVRRGRDEKDNAYPLYLKLCPDKDGKGGFPKPEGKAAEQFEKAIGRVWTKEEFPELAEYLNDLQPAIVRFREATRKQAFWEPAGPDVISTLEIAIPAAVNGQQAVKAWNVQLWEMDSRSSKHIRAFCTSALRFASHIEQNSTTINGLIAMQSRNLAYSQLLSGLDDRIFNPNEAKALLRLCQKLDRGNYSLERCWLVEWAFCLDGIQLFWLKEARDPKLSKKAKSLLDMAGVSDSETRKTPPNLESTAEFADMHFRELVSTARLHGSSRLGVDLVRDIEDRAAQSIRKNLALRPFIAKLHRASELTLRVRAFRQGTLMVLALHVHYAKHGKWPKTLKAIDPKLGLKGLKKIIIDPYSDKSFIYKLKDGQPLLYSVGVDGKDDGGVHHSKFGDGATGPADFVFWPYQKPETK